MRSKNILLVGICAIVCLQSVVSFSIKDLLRFDNKKRDGNNDDDDGRIPTYDDELEKVDAAKKGMEDKQAIMDLREQAFQHCMKNIRGGYYKYEDYVYCKPYVEDETAKFIEENNLAPQQPSSDEIIKVESAERPADEPDAHTYEFYDEDWDENEADFLDDEKHLKLQVGFWERLWNRLLDGESPWSTTQTE